MACEVTLVSCFRVLLNVCSNLTLRFWEIPWDLAAFSRISLHRAFSRILASSSENNKDEITTNINHKFQEGRKQQHFVLA